MMKALLSLMLFIAIGVHPLIVQADELRINGAVVDDKTRKPLPGVLVTIRPVGESKVVKFTQTRSDGRFELTLAQEPSNHELLFRIMGYASKSVLLVNGKTTYDIALSEKATAIKEVVVKSKGIGQRGDTVTYLVSNFANVQDKTLADVLKKMPGIEVSKSGSISYNGVAINKFYIEGKDLMGGRYGLATNSIHQQDVGSVEVMENHQPIKALQDLSFTKNPAINIRLKNDAQSRWVGSANFGIGVTPFLWKDELIAMRFSAKTQTLNTYKTNNTGIDVTSNARSFSLSDLLSQFDKSYKLSSYIDVSPNHLNDIDESRVILNKSHLISSNNLWTLGKTYDLTTQVTYTNRRLTSDCSSQTIYYLTDSTLTINETEHAFSRQNTITGDITLSANTQSYYFKNKLSTNIKWDDVNMSILGTYPNNQSANIPHRQVSNDLELIKRKGDKSFSLSSFNLYQTKPQDLSITKSGIQHQGISSSAFFTNTNTSLAFALNPAALSLRLGIVGVSRSLESELAGVSNTVGLLKNENTMRYLNLYLSPKMEYKQGAFHANFDMPLSLVTYNYRDKIEGQTSTKTKLNLSPLLYISYYLTPRLLASVVGHLSQSPVAEQQFYSGIIMNDYRNLSQGFVDYRSGSSISATGSLSYKNPLKGLFANTSVTKVWNRAPRIGNRIFLDQYILNTSLALNNNTDMLLVNGSISKRIDAIASLLSLRSSFSSSSASMYQGNQVIPYDLEKWSIAPTLTSSIGRWCNIAYEMRFAKDWLKMGSIGERSSFNHFNQKLTCCIVPAEKCYIRLTGEHYSNQVTSNTSKRIYLADADLTYCFKGGCELNIAVTNLFDQTVYAYSCFDGLTSISKSYNIRPRNIMMSIFFRF